MPLKPALKRQRQARFMTARIVTQRKSGSKRKRKFKSFRTTILNRNQTEKITHCILVLFYIQTAEINFLRQKAE